MDLAICTRRDNCEAALAAGEVDRKKRDDDDSQSFRVIQSEREKIVLPPSSSVLVSGRLSLHKEVIFYRGCCANCALNIEM